MDKKEPGMLVAGGMGGFLCPPTHPEHSFHIQIEENRGGMSLSAAVECEWLEPKAKGAASGRLKRWERGKLPLSHPAVIDWIHHVLGYFRGCYGGRTPDGKETWNASDLLISQELDPMLNEDCHAGVHLIREYYPEYMPSRSDFDLAYWGKPPHAGSPTYDLETGKPAYIGGVV